MDFENMRPNAKPRSEQERGKSKYKQISMKVSSISLCFSSLLPHFQHIPHPALHSRYSIPVRIFEFTNMEKILSNFRTVLKALSFIFQYEIRQRSPKYKSMYKLYNFTILTNAALELWTSQVKESTKQSPNNQFKG